MEFHRKPHTFAQEVSLTVEDLDRSLTFYKNVLGFHVLTQTGQQAILTADGTTPLVSLEQRDNLIPKQSNTTGLYHYALLLPSRADLAAILQHFIDLNYPLGASDHIVSEALYINDPDGHGIEVYADRPSSAWEWINSEVAMATKPIDANSLLKERKGAWTGLPRETIVGHIHLHVSELHQTKQFYTEGLGFDVVATYHQALFMSTGGYHHHIAINTWNGVGAPPPPENSPKLNWYSIVFPSDVERDEAVSRIQSLGIDVKREDEIYVTKDPSGNTIKLTV